MAKLDTYRRKRDPQKTPEPFGGKRSRRGAPVFVVQRHAARSLHYDFRLERDGVLASWAVPKGLPTEYATRALAVHVEDHPLEYGSFEGEIPKGEYGAGTVEIWDRGTYDLLEEKRDGGLTVRLHGKRYDGVWTLVPAHLDGKEQNWLLLRKHDEESRPKARTTYRPMLATVAEALPHGGGWLYEVKFDGYRALAYVRGGICELRSRADNDLTTRFASVATALAKVVGKRDTVLDGEVVALDGEGRPSFSAMQQGTGVLVYYAFDVLELDGEPTVDLPLAERKEQLHQLIGRKGGKTVLYSEGFEDGEALLGAVAAQRLEGVVAKRRASKYAQGRRTRDWLKIKTFGRQEFVIAGHTRGSGTRSGTFGSLVLGVNDGGELRYAGNVGTGFDQKEIRRLLGLFKPLERPDSPFREVPRMPRVRRGDVTWLEPKLVAEVAFSEWTHDGHVRQPSYKGLRDDKPAGEVRHERPPNDVIRSGEREVKLVNLDKPFWPDEGITKGDLLEYYRQVAPAIVPHLAGRPFTMRRYPDGAYGKAFFQKDAPSHMPSWIRTFRANVSTRQGTKKNVDFPVVDDELSLLWMVNMGCIDMNPWYSRIDKPERPDFVLFDLDPTPEVPWAQTMEVAHLVRGLLDDLGLDSYPKTSGGKGFHILVPVARRSTYDDTREFSELIAGTIARAYPKLATTQWSKAKRRGVLIDANQNGMGKTIASVYSVRPHPGAPVSTPLEWSEVTPKLDPKAFTMGVVLERVAKRGDLFRGALEGKQSLAAALRRL
jgi:bifunctional non-homologous end joining protein LigD